jgi:hypothetical protein
MDIQGFAGKKACPWHRPLPFLTDAKIPCLACLFFEPMQELQRALVNGNWSQFSEEACRLMIGDFV